MLSKTKVFIHALRLYFYNNFITNTPYESFRKFYIKRIMGISVGKNVHIGMRVRLNGTKLKIGDNCIINRDCYLDNRDWIILKDNVGISSFCKIFTMSHNPNSKTFSTYSKKVVINSNSWVASNSTILPGVLVECNSVIGCCSVVTKDVEKNSIVVGNPAKKIKSRVFPTHYKLYYKPWFDTDYE